MLCHECNDKLYGPSGSARITITSAEEFVFCDRWTCVLAFVLKQVLGKF